ncbi:MAG: alanine--tRNA ligase [Bacteroidota bacterium]
MKSSKGIRKQFLDFFRQKTHEIVPSAPIVVKDDPSLMFTNAGMNQFKDVFLGLKSPTSTRVADTQKCLRVSGKHNDLEEVGHDTYHHTMFEMLGNWSFGDYYKKEAIAWAWELLTEGFGLEPDRLYATIFGGDPTDGLEKDDEAVNEWSNFLPEERILPYGRKDNFWEMGDTGPCGPCSEIHIDLRPEKDRKKVDGATLVNSDHPQVVEIWNLVFIQFNRKADSSLEELPAKHVDTGMGFERLVMAIQNRQSTYDIDLFDHMKAYLKERTGLTYEKASDIEQVAIRVVMDHIRAVAFAIADGQIPSNTGAGYVIRRILRRASRYAFSYLHIHEPFLFELIDLMVDEYQEVFPELVQQKDFVQRIIQSEEKGFLRKLESGTQLFQEYLKEHPKEKTIEGAFAFKLYDTFGFPIDLTELMAREVKKKVDMEGFQQLLEEQKERSRSATAVQTGDWVAVNPSSDLPRFLGYDMLELDTRIQQYRTVKAKKKTLYQIVLEETPFYAESGGQVGDRGTLKNGAETLRVLDTQKENELIVHLVDKLPSSPGGTWTAQVDPSLRRKTRINHTATHILHAALRETLGTHVEQRGSLVSEKSLRFDFSHFSRVEPEELTRIEQIVNERITAAIPLQEYREVPIDKAKGMGAMALFGEKYGDLVRVIVFDPDYSVELCGGTHARNTSEIQVFKILSEGSVAAGVRRIEALTADGALHFFQEKVATLDRIGAQLKSNKPLDEAVEDLLEKHKELEKQLQAVNAEKVGQLKKELLEKSTKHNGIHLIKEVVLVSSSDDLKQLSYELRKSTSNTLIVLGALINDKPLLSVILSNDLAEKKTYNAGQMIRTLAKEIQGGGGGQDFYATAGGKKKEGLKDALDKVVELI